jgi:exonuclease SbcD
MRFIHTADIHLDSPLTGLTAYQDAPAQLLRTATRDAFDNLITEAISEKVDFMVIAGDLYDGNWKDFNTGIYFAGQMGRLNAAGIPVYLLLGNHDAESEMTRKLVLPANVHRFPSNKAATFTIPELRVALHGRSFKEAATTDNLAVHYPDPVAGWLNIGVLHTALEGNTAHANYAPCSIAELEARGYQYWALGHVHEHRVWRGASTVAFPGNLQGRHIREAGARGALLVTATGTEIDSVERLIVDVLRWHSLSVDVAACQDLPDVVRQVGRAMQDLLARAVDAHPIALRVNITGASPAHGQLFGLEPQLRAEVLAQAAALGGDRLWVEKVRVDTTPHDSADVLAARSDAVADLQALLAQADTDPAFMQGLQEGLMQMVGKLPLEVIGALPVLEDIRAGRLQPLVQATAPSLLAHLAKAG